jgi:acyl-CoA thioesterase-1
LSAVAGIVILGGTGVAGLAIKKQVSDAQYCQKVVSFIEANGPVIQTASGSPKVAIIGDSYSAGDGLQDRTQGWAYRIGKTQGWDTYVAGVGMTGYVNRGYCGDQAFGERITQVSRLHPDTLIIQGGLNDWEASERDVELAAGMLLDQVSDLRRVVLVGPTNSPERGNLERVDHALAAAAEKHQRQYVSALGWDLEFLPDDLHLTPAGHADFAARVAASVG